MGPEVTLGANTEAAFIIDVAFWVISASTIISAVAVVQFRDLFRAALSLVVAFLGVAGLFILLRAEFLAVVQVIIYVGAISVLIIFAILMTRDVQQGSPSNRLQVPAAILAALFLAASAFVTFNTEWVLLESAIGGFPEATRGLIVEAYSDTVPKLADLLLRDFVLAFELASVLLLAAIIGALVLIRER